MDTIKQCKCGAKYKLIEHSIMMRDKDSLECDDCGEELIKWNGGCFYTKVRIDQISSN